MSVHRFIDIDGRRYLWRDLVALRQAQALPRAEQPSLFELHEDHRPLGERNATERYCEPSLFAVIEIVPPAKPAKSQGQPPLHPAKDKAPGLYS